MVHQKPRRFHLRARRPEQLTMHTSFLNRYFDIEAWHRDLFMALLEYQPRWTWQDLSDAFMQVSCHLNTPRGSASQRPAWINHFNRLEWCRIESAEGETDAAKIIVHAHSPALPRQKPRCSRALLKAICWSVNLRRLEVAWEEVVSTARSEAFAYVDVPDRSYDKLNRMLKRVEYLCGRRDKEIAKHRRKFRLAD
jgi:hypothetical protein